MEELENSTLDLIYRRRVRSHFPGYVVVFLIVLAISSLPLVKVDVVTSVRGMVRPVNEPSELFSPLGGMVDSSILMDNRPVDAGDTLVWIRRDLPEAKITGCQERIRIQQASAADIQGILAGKKPLKTTQYRQSYRNHLAARSRLEIRKEFLLGEYNTAQILYTDEVISRHEFEKAQSSFRDICARESDLCEEYKSILEGDLFRIQSEIKQIWDEIRLTQSSLDEYFILAPASGILYESRGLSSGSVIHAGMSLGMISPSGLLAAECYLNPAHIASVEEGSRVKLRFDDGGFRTHHPLDAEVDLLDEEVCVYNGIPSYRIRCTLHDTKIRYTNGSCETLKNGMTFTASFILFRHSLASLILEKANLWVNPSLTVSRDEKGS
ncbi:MAG: HlyD family efflux transporter periplasmic adaptor subunit [Bacteroidota bacterium]